MLKRKKKKSVRIETPEERFWRRERLTNKYAGVEKNSRAKQAGKERPARSARYMREVEERFRRRMAGKISRELLRYKRVEANFEAMNASLEKRISDPAASFQSVVKSNLEVNELEIKKARAEKRYLETVLEEVKKGNVTAGSGIKTIREKIDGLFKRVQDIISDSVSLAEILKGVKKDVHQDYAIVRKQMRENGAYMNAFTNALELRKNFRRVKRETEFKAIIDLVMLDMNLKTPKEIKPNEMLRAFYVTQQRINCLKAEISVLKKQLLFLERFGMRFEALQRTVRSLKRNKEHNLGINNKTLKSLGKWWKKKPRKRKPK